MTEKSSCGLPFLYCISAEPDATTIDYLFLAKAVIKDSQENSG